MIKNSDLNRLYELYIKSYFNDNSIEVKEKKNNNKNVFHKINNSRKSITRLNRVKMEA